MPLVSNYFRINKSQAQLDFVDVDTEKDLQLFIANRAMRGRLFVTRP
jgi:hypothetical protein